MSLYIVTHIPQKTLLENWWSWETASELWVRLPGIVRYTGLPSERKLSASTLTSHRWDPCWKLLNIFRTLISSWVKRELQQLFHRATKRNRASLVAQLVKTPPANAGDVGLIPGSGRSPGEGNGNPLQYSCLENPIDRGAWQATAHGIAVRYDWAHTHGETDKLKPVQVI